jgi:hypothetical protein
MFYRVLLRVLAAAGAGALLLVPAGTAFGGDPNAGDVWVDNVGQPAGPGHEMDPHLACQDIDLWGAKLADSSGSYSIDGWPPSGSQEQDYVSSWSVNASQPLDVISVKTLIANAVANGDVPQANQGFHFKLEFSQDPQKHKTFWVDCPVPAPPPVTNPTPPPTNTVPGQPPTTVQNSIGAITQSISATRVMRCRRGMVKVTKRVHGRKLIACVAKKKRHAARARRRVHRRDPVFTG